MPQRPEITDGAASRSTPAVDRARLRVIHDKLSRIQVVLPGETRRRDARPLRDLFRLVREKRNKINPVIGWLVRTRAELRADLVRVERVFAASRAYIFNTNDGLVGTSNEKQREGRIASLLRVDLDAKAALEADLELVDGAIAHAKLVLEDLSKAHDETSRILSSLDLEWRIEGKVV